MEENKGNKPASSGKLQLKKTINAGQIKQSFSHGRSRSVSVEVKKKRTLSGFAKNEKVEQPKSDETLLPNIDENFKERKSNEESENVEDKKSLSEEIEKKEYKKTKCKEF